MIFECGVIMDMKVMVMFILLPLPLTSSKIGFQFRQAYGISPIIRSISNIIDSW